jgi:hypothetical protein
VRFCEPRAATIRIGVVRTEGAAVNRLAGALAIRPGEGRVVVIVAAAFAGVEAGRGLGEVAVQALILDSVGPSILPPCTSRSAWSDSPRHSRMER